ncbi:MAG: T9SS type A sorting domain-containing protein [Bacteroidota bacterium]
MKTSKLLLTLSFILMGSMVMAQDFYIYVSDAANFSSGEFKIVQFDPDGENPIDYIVDELAWPQDIVFLEDEDRVLVSNLGSGRITKHNSRTGAYIEDFAAVAGGPTRMKIGDDGLLYVLQWSNTNNKVLRYQLDGTLVDEYTDTGVVQSIGIDWDDASNLYVSSFGGGLVQQYDDSGIDAGTFIDSNLSGPTNLEIKDGVMYVLDWNAGKCVRFDATTGDFIDDFITTLQNPEGLAFLPNGHLLIGDNGTNSVREFDANGNDLGDYTNGGNIVTPNAVVLRDSIFLSVSEEVLNTVMATPSIGSQFAINPKMALNFRTIDIYDVNGALITSIELSNTSIWSAQDLSEGIYFMVATTPNGQKTSQKIVVQRK